MLYSHVSKSYLIFFISVLINDVFVAFFTIKTQRYLIF